MDPDTIVRICQFEQKGFCFFSFPPFWSDHLSFAYMLVVVSCGKVVFLQQTNRAFGLQ